MGTQYHHPNAVEVEAVADDRVMDLLLLAVVLVMHLVATVVLPPMTPTAVHLLFTINCMIQGPLHVPSLETNNLTLRQR